MILRSEEVTQTIDGDRQGRFLKDLIEVPGAEPLAMVRKRLPPELAPRSGYLAPLLLTHGFGQNRYAWHLSGRSFVNHLAAQGFDVYNVDLRGHGRSRKLGSRPAHNVDDYIREDLPAALNEMLTVSGHARGFTVGHSLGGLIACAAAPEIEASLAGIVTLGTPYRFAQGNPSLVALSRLIELLSGMKILTSGPGRIPVRMVGRWLHMYRIAWDSPYLPFPVRPWAPGALEPKLLAEYLRTTFDSATVGTLMQMSRLALRGEFRSFDDRTDYGARFEKCDVPLLVIAGSRDQLAPPASVRPAYDRSYSSDRTYRVVPLGHADLLIGRDAPELTWHLVTNWLKARAHLVTAPARRERVGT